ncbi:MAG: hypothetical protein ACI87O_001430 [Planctomycetota bacterium]|jgi:hypothetical protein
MKAQYVLWLLLCWIPAACGSKDPGQAAPQETEFKAEWNWVPSNSGGFWAAWRPVEGSVEMGPSFAIELQLSEGEAGAPLDLKIGQIDVGARMPEHQHGMLQSVETRRIGPGHYNIEGLRFHMLGYWQLQVDVNRPPITERAQFDIQL